MNNFKFEHSQNFDSKINVKDYSWDILESEPIKKLTITLKADRTESLYKCTIDNVSILKTSRENRLTERTQYNFYIVLTINKNDQIFIDTLYNEYDNDPQEIPENILQAYSYIVKQIDEYYKNIKNKKLFLDRHLKIII